MTLRWDDDPVRRQDGRRRLERHGNQTAGGEGGAGPISICNHKQRSLGPEWSMSKVGTPPPHSSDKSHGLVESINKNKKRYIFMVLWLAPTEPIRYF